MRKKLKYNSDFMSREMDKALEQIEDKLSALYANAAFDINREFAKFTDEFKERDAILAQRVENGMMSEEEYIGWRQRHILQSERYKGTVDTITNTLVSTDQAAMALVNGAMPSVIAQSYDFTQALGWKAAEESGLTQGTFQIYNARSVQKIIKENPDLLKHVDVEEDRRWNMDKVNKEIASSIVKGDSIEKVADGLQRVTSMDRNAAVRNARTAMTAAENMGRAEAADDLKAQGIPMDEVWSATYDDRTRETHLELDGTYRDENGLFGVGIIKTPLRFPADPLGDPEEIYNCRCRMNLQLKGIDHSQDGDAYREFMSKNFPETWETMQKNESIQKSLDTFDVKRAEAEAKKPAEAILPAPEKVSLEDTKASESGGKIEESAFTPAASIEEAEQFARDNLVDKGGFFKLTGKDVSFKGISLDVANTINQRLNTIFDNFNLDKLTSLEAFGKKDKKWYSSHSDAPMMTSNYGNIGLNNVLLKNADSISAYVQEGRSNFDYVIENIDSLTGRHRELAETYMTAGRSLVDDSIEGMITHEVGHFISYGDLNKEFAEISKGDEWKEYASELSGYANASFGEYVAESFSAYFNGETDKLQPEIVEIFDSLRRKK